MSGLEARGAVVGLDPLGKGMVLEQPTQPAPVMGDSVVAFVQDADDQGDHLPLDLAEGGRPRHHLPVQLVMSSEPFGVEGVNPEDRVDRTRDRSLPRTALGAGPTLRARR